MADHKKNYSRCTIRQKEELINYMSLHKNLANGNFTGPLGLQRATAQWNSLKELLKEYGPDRTIDQWKLTWRDLKKRARNKNAQVNIARVQTGNTMPIPEMSQDTELVLGTIGKDSSQGIGPAETVCVHPSTSHTEEDEIVFQEPIVNTDTIIESTPHNSRNKNTHNEFLQAQLDMNKLIETQNNILMEHVKLIKEQNEILKRMFTEKTD